MIPERRYEYSPEVYIQRSANFINQNYAAIRVSDVVEYVGFTRSYFSTLFKKHIRRQLGPLRRIPATAAPPPHRTALRTKPTCFPSSSIAPLHPLLIAANLIDDVPAKLLIIKAAAEHSIPVISCMGTGNKLDPTKLST